MTPAGITATVLFVDDHRRSKEFYERAFEVAPINEDDDSVNADAACAEMGERGIELVNGPVDQPWGIRAAIFADPDGHLWEVAAEL